MINEEKAVTNMAIIDLKRYLLVPLLVAISVLMILIFGVKFIVIVFVLCFLSISLSFVLQKYVPFYYTKYTEMDG